MTIPIYNSEIAPPAKRGMIAGLHAQFVGIGFAVSNVSSNNFLSTMIVGLIVPSGSVLGARTLLTTSNGGFHLLSVSFKSYFQTSETTLTLPRMRTRCHPSSRKLLAALLPSLAHGERTRRRSIYSPQASSRKHRSRRVFLPS